MVSTQGRAGRTSLSFQSFCITFQLFAKYEPYYWTGEARSAGGKLTQGSDSRRPKHPKKYGLQFVNFSYVQLCDPKAVERGRSDNFYQSLGLKGGSIVLNLLHFESYFVISGPKKFEISSNFWSYVKV
jgi:hypothetical protein